MSAPTYKFDPAKLREALRHRGLDSMDLVEPCGVSPSTVARWVLGKNAPLSTSVSKLVEVLKLDSWIDLYSREARS
jgi:predicted transcriptional regulator